MKHSKHTINNEVTLYWDAEWKSLDAILTNCKTMQQMKDMDRDAIDNRGIPSLWLMENAARSVVEIVITELNENDLDETNNNDKLITIVCGAGNNGGDGVACAYMLMDMGYKVHAYLCGKDDKITADEAAMEKRLIERGGKLIRVFDQDVIDEKVVTILKSDIEQSSCCIDALFGVGISREIKEPYSSIINMMNTASFIVSCDIPSGINGDTGMVMGGAAKADITVTFSCIKTGLLTVKAAPYIGKLYVVPIGIPEIKD